MAADNQIPLGVYIDKNAPYNNSLGYSAYVPTVGKSFYISTIKSIRNVTIGSTTYGQFTHYPTDGQPAEKVTVLEASGTIIGLCNA